MLNSHIQMPKLLLKNFQNRYNHLCYYDVSKQLIGTKGSAKSINTEYGYYSENTEKYLEQQIETPFSNILKYLDEIGVADKKIVPVRTNITEVIFDFMYSLVARSPSFHEMINESDSFLSQLPKEEKRDYIIKTGINTSRENSIFSEYIVTFMFNKTDVPFVLSMNGIYNYILNGNNVVNLPITPKIAICLIHKNYASRIINDDGSISMFEITNPKDIMTMNRRAFSFQVIHGWGYIVCPEKTELERLVEIFNQN